MGIFSNDDQEYTYNTYDQRDQSNSTTAVQADDNEGILNNVNLSKASNSSVTLTDYGSVQSAIKLSGEVVNAQTELSNNFLNSAEKLALQTQGQALEYNQSATQNALKFADNALKSDQGETAGLIKWASGLAALVLMSFAFVKSKG